MSEITESDIEEGEIIDFPLSGDEQPEFSGTGIHNASFSSNDISPKKSCDTPISPTSDTASPQKTTTLVKTVHPLYTPKFEPEFTGDTSLASEIHRRFGTSAKLNRKNNFGSMAFPPNSNMSTLPLKRKAAEGNTGDAPPKKMSIKSEPKETEAAEKQQQQRQQSTSQPSDNVNNNDDADDGGDENDEDDIPVQRRNDKQADSTIVEIIQVGDLDVQTGNGNDSGKLAEKIKKEVTDDTPIDNMDVEDLEKLLDTHLESEKAKNDSVDTTQPVREQIERISLKDPPRVSSFDVIPDGWIEITHHSGIPVYLHKATRVCTFSRPYSVGSVGIRRHRVPVAAIPCLNYRRHKEAKQVKDETGTNNASTSSSNSVSESNQVNSEPVTVGTTNKESQPASATNADSSRKGASSSCAAGVSEKQCKQAEHAALASSAVLIETFEEYQRSKQLDADQLNEYCSNLFDFERVKFKKYPTWKDRRNDAKNRHKAQKDAERQATLPKETKLIRFKLPENMYGTKREIVVNPANKTPIQLLHDYVRGILRHEVDYLYGEAESTTTPYYATVKINEIQYATGYATSKRLAKLEAARLTLAILLPHVSKLMASIQNSSSTEKESDDIALFDELAIDDPRITELSNQTNRPAPYQILQECLKRNFGFGDTSISCSGHTVNNKRCEFSMSVGKHSVTVTVKNKRQGKQAAAQAILALLHPAVKCWGGLLRLYGELSSETIRKQKDAQREVTEIGKGVRGKRNPKVNKLVLEKLRNEMLKIYEKRFNETGRSNVANKKTKSSQSSSKTNNDTTGPVVDL